MDADDVVIGLGEVHDESAPFPAESYPVTAPTPERRVGEARVREIGGRDWASGRYSNDEVRGLALDLLDARKEHGEMTEMFLGACITVSDHAETIRGAQADCARLTAEVERLTKEKAEAVSVARELEAMVSRWAGSATCHEQSARLAALSLPTHAEPEVKNDKS